MFGVQSISQLLNNMTATKAIRATIQLGGIAVDGFQLPDGSYGYSYEWLAEYLLIDKQLLSNKKSPFYIYKLNESLSKAGLFNRRVLVEGISNAKLTYLTSVELMTVFGSLSSFCPSVINLLVACSIEALERRFDTAFGVTRNEEERNAQLKARMTGKEKRRTLTDAIQTYIEKHPECSENYQKFIYSNCTDYHNLIVLGMRSKQAKEELDLKPSQLLRDNLSEKALGEIATVEEIACRIIEHEDLEPLEAVKKSVAIHYTKTIGL